MAVGAAGGFVAGSILGKLMMDKSGWDKSVSDVAKDEKKLQGMTGRLSKNFDNMGRKMQAAGTKMTVAGAAILAGLGLMINKYVQAGDQIDKMAKRTGFAAETLSELSYAAQISGADITSLEKGVKRMSKTIVDANDGMATYVRAFDRIGISVENLMGLSPEEQFLKIGDAIASLEDPTMRAATAQDIFGRAGTQLLPLFAEGADGLQKLRDRAHELGIVFDEEAAAKAAKLQDAQTALKESISGLVFALSESLVPVVTSLVEKITDIVSKVGEWTRAHPGLTKAIMGITAALGGILTVGGTVLVTLGTLLRSFGTIQLMMPKLIGSIRTMGVAFKAALGPIGLVTAAIVAAGVALNAWINARKRAMDAEMDAMMVDTKLGDALKARKILVEGNIITQQEWTDLVNKHGRDYKKVMNAIATDPNLKNLKDELDKVKKSQEGLNEEAGKGEKVFKSLSKQVETELIPAKKGLSVQLDNLTYSYMSFTDIALQALDELKDWNEEAIPAARDFSDLLGEYPEKFEDVAFESKKTTGSITLDFGGMTDGLVTKWSEMFGNFITSGDIFRGNFKGLLDGLKTQFTDTLGNMLSEFLNTFLKGMLSGASGFLSELGSSLGSMFGGGGASSLAGGLNNVFSSLTSIVNPIGAIASAIAGIANLAALGSKPAGFSEHMWYLRETQENTQEMRDYMFIEQWKMLQYQIEQNHDIRDNIWKVNEKVKAQKPILESIDKGVHGVIDAVNGVAKAISKITKAQHGMVATHPTLAMIGDIPGHVPEIATPVPAIPALAQAMGGGTSNHLSFNINAIDARGVREAVRRDIIPEINRALASNVGKSDLKRTLGIA